MAKFCIKCGSALDENGECPHCNNQVKPGNQKKPLAKKIKALLILLIILFIIAIAALCYFSYKNIISVPILSDITNRIKYGSHSVINDELAQTDTSGLTHFESSQKDVDTENGISYLNNEILITLKSSDNKPDLDSYLSSVGGKIVGEISAISDYQVQLDHNRSYQELKSIVDDLESKPWVNNASLNYAFKMELNNYYPNDTEWFNEWKDEPGGINWGMEAIDAPGAWDYMDELTNVNVGVFDNMFDENNPELIFQETPLNNRKAMEISNGEFYSHGTMVSGVIAATFDNDHGTAGISPKTNLYGAVDLYVHGISEYSFFQAVKESFTYLIVNKKCKVINISEGYNSIVGISASRNNQYGLNILKEPSAEASQFLKSLIDEGNDFVLCVTAGNGNADKFYLKDHYNDSKEFPYYTQVDRSYYEEIKKDRDAFYSSLDEENVPYYEKLESYFKEHENFGDLDIRVESNGVLDSSIGAKFNSPYCYIDDPIVKNRIIVVGAVKHLVTNDWLADYGMESTHKGYAISKFSQCGDRVDIVAPGEEIYVLTGGGYEKTRGTSVANVIKLG